MKKVLGIDVGGTNVDVVLLNGDRFEYIASKPTKEVFSDFRKFIKSLLSTTNACKVGIGIAAWLKFKEGKLKPVFAPNLPDLKCLGNLEDVTNKVYIDNDANCFALFASKSLNSKNLVGITVGTGIGSGIVVEGKVYRGCGMAGEIGHVTVSENGRPCGCGFKGHLESYFGGRAFGFEGKDVKELVKNKTIYVTEGFEYFCREVANVVRLLDPEVVAIGGRIGMNLDMEIVRSSVFRFLHEYYDTRIVAVKDELAVAKGACYICEE